MGPFNTLTQGLVITLGLYFLGAEIPGDFPNQISTWYASYTGPICQCHFVYNDATLGEQGIVDTCRDMMMDRNVSNYRWELGNARRLMQDILEHRKTH